MKIIQLLIAVLTLGIISQSVLAQQQPLHVHVLDYATQTPLQGVQIKGLEHFETDAKGMTDIFVEDGNEKLQFLQPDYYPVWLQMVATNLNPQQELTIYLVHVSKEGNALQSLRDQPAQVNTYEQVDYYFANEKNAASFLRLSLYDSDKGFAYRCAFPTPAKLFQVKLSPGTGSSSDRDSSQSGSFVHLISSEEKGRQVILQSR